MQIKRPISTLWEVGKTISSGKLRNTVSLTLLVTVLSSKVFCTHTNGVWCWRGKDNAAEGYAMRLGLWVRLSFND